MLKRPERTPDALSTAAGPDAAGRERAARTSGLEAELIGVLLLGAVVFLFHLGSYRLWEPDEARYAEVAREMAVLGDYVVPHLNYVAYVEKPPLLYWLGALSMRLLGADELAARLVPALAALAGLIATCLFVRRVFDRRRALLAGAILATSPLYALMAQVLTTDMLLSATMTVALFAFFLHWREGGRWCWVMYVAVALGILAKGPVALVLPALVGALFLWRERALAGALSRFRVIPGCALTALLATPWFVAVAVREPGFIPFYFVGEHLRRFLEPTYSHGEPLYYYVPVLLLGMMPWTLVVPFLGWRGARPDAARRFLALSALVIFAFFSLASAKLIPYILPAVAPLAILVADGIISRAHPGVASGGRVTSFEPRRLAAVGALVALGGVLALFVGAAARHLDNPYPARVQPVLVAVGPLLAAGGVLTGWGFWRRQTDLALGGLVATTACALLLGTWARLLAEPLRSYAGLARAVAARAATARIICYPRYVQAVPFYTRRRVILVGPKTELRFGAEHDPEAGRWFFDSESDLMRLWREPGATVLIVDESDLRRLAPRLGAFSVIGAEREKRAVLNSDDHS